MTARSLTGWPRLASATDMPRISAACVSTRRAIGAAESSSSRIACSRAMRPSRSAGKPATSMSSPAASAVLPAGKSATAPVASVRRNPSPAALTTPRIRTRCADAGGSTVHQRLHREPRDVRRDRRRPGDRDLARRRDQQPRRAGAAVGVVVGHEDAVHRDAGVEVLRRVGAADLAHPDGEILAVGAHRRAPGGRAHPSTRCGRCRPPRRTGIGGGRRRRRPP